MYNIQCDNNISFQWSQTEVESRLNEVADLNDKAEAWICADLTTSPSSLLGRIFWAIAKHFNCMREYLYGVNLEQSQRVLEGIGRIIETQDQNYASIDLYNTAVQQFNRIAPRHHVDELVSVQNNAPAEDEEDLDVDADEVNVGVDAVSTANRFLKDALNQNTPLTAQDVHSFQDAETLDLKSAHYPICKTSLDLIFANCPQLKNVALRCPTKLGSVSEHSRRELIANLGPNLSVFETIRYILDKRYSQPNGSLLNLKLSKSENQIKLFQKLDYIEQQMFLEGLHGNSPENFFNFLKKMINYYDSSSSGLNFTRDEQSAFAQCCPAISLIGPSDLLLQSFFYLLTKLESGSNGASRIITSLTVNQLDYLVQNIDQQAFEKLFNAFWKFLGNSSTFKFI